MLVDSHCHLDFPELAGRLDQVLVDMATHDVGHALCVCVTLTDFEQVLALAMRDHRLSASVGVHPDHQGAAEPDVATLVRLAGHPKVVAVGETGLDYYRAQGDTGWQRERFRTHIRAARLAAKPLIVHTRAASADTLRLMREERADEAGGVMHCFTEDWATAKAALDLGFYLSFSGIVTFRNAAALREVAAKVPDDRLLIETDAPYLAPVPYRGKTNEPAFVRFVAASLAEFRRQPLPHVAEVTTENFFNLFKDSRKIVNA
ncbi:MAG: TatD family deoxyribonuclease [Burkholderiales bacterium]|nr:MAG: TatD family deoxyribonuclease [Burkholderiales bacterium]